MEDQYCDMCTAPMEQTKSIGTKESGKISMYFKRGTIRQPTSG